MNDWLLRYYDEELGHIRRDAAQFAADNAGRAENLRLSAKGSDDPHVERLIQAFAYLTARIRLKLDDDFPELTDALLEVLYPHFLAPVPAMAILQFRPKPELEQSLIIPRTTDLDSEPVDGQRCRFRTTQSVELWPVEVVGASLLGQPFAAPAHPAAQEAKAVLRLTLACIDPAKTFTDLGVDRLRFFINAQPLVAFRLYEILFNNVIAVALADGAEDKRPILLAPERIGAVGFDPEEGVLPHAPRSFLGYRLLTELFCFPEKFLFFDLSGLTAKSLHFAGNRLEVFFYLGCPPPENAALVNASVFALGCTPIVNLFQSKAEPIPLDHTQSEYPVIVDERRPDAYETYSIDRVDGSSPAGQVDSFLPLYGTHHGETAGGGRYWFATRRARTGRDRSTEMSLSLVDLDLDPSVPADWTLAVDVTAFNRDLPARLPYGGGHPLFQLADGGPTLFDLSCLTPPSPVLRPEGGGGARWRLISQLSLNHLSLLDGPAPAAALREMLTLYDLKNAQSGPSREGIKVPETWAIIDGIVGVNHRRATARAPVPDMPVMCRGLDIDLTMDLDRAGTLGIFLPAVVLERFMALYAGINSFTRITLWVKDRAEPVCRFPARAGARQTL